MSDLETRIRAAEAARKNRPREIDKGDGWTLEHLPGRGYRLNVKDGRGAQKAKRIAANAVSAFRLGRPEQEFKRTGNPLWVWDCIRYCEQSGTEYPAWVRGYLADSADRLLDIDPATTGKDRLPRAAMAAISLSTSGGASLFLQYRKSKRRLSALYYVKSLERDGQMSRAEIYRMVARMLNESPSTIRSWCRSAE
jgi:hypothetical protein